MKKNNNKQDDKNSNKRARDEDHAASVSPTQQPPAKKNCTLVIEQVESINVSSSFVNSTIMQTSGAPLTFSSSSLSGFSSVTQTVTTIEHSPLQQRARTTTVSSFTQVADLFTPPVSPRTHNIDADHNLHQALQAVGTPPRQHREQPEPGFVTPEIVRVNIADRVPPRIVRRIRMDNLADAQVQAADPYSTPVRRNLARRLPPPIVQNRYPMHQQLIRELRNVRPGLVLNLHDNSDEDTDSEESGFVLAPINQDAARIIRQIRARRNSR